MESTIQKIAKSREVLRTQLGNRNYNIDELPKFSELEIKKCFEMNKGNDQAAELCNFSLSHNEIPEWKIHIIYFNFPPSNPTISSKVLKTVILDNYTKYNAEDNIIIVLPANITTAKETYISWIDIIQMEINKPEEGELFNEIIENQQFSQRHMANVQIFNINALCVNILEHELVPEHILITSNQDIKDIMENNNITNKSQFPIIQKHDSVAEIIGAVSGDIVEIERVSKSGSSRFYRLCK